MLCPGLPSSVLAIPSSYAFTIHCLLTTHILYNPTGITFYTSFLRISVAILKEQEFSRHFLVVVRIFLALSQALNLYEMLKDLSSLKETSCVCQFLSQLSLYKQKWQFSLPSVHALLLERVVYLTSSSAALLSNRSNLKQVEKESADGAFLEPNSQVLSCNVLYCCLSSAAKCKLLCELCSKNGDSFFCISNVVMYKPITYNKHVHL